MGKQYGCIPNSRYKRRCCSNLSRQKSKLRLYWFLFCLRRVTYHLSKVKAKEEATISSIVGPRELYRLTDTLYQDNPQMEGRQSTGHKYSLGANIFDIFPELFSDTCTVNESEMAEIYGRADNRRCFKWIKRRYITQPDNFEKYKVIIPEANGTGAIGEVLSTPLVGVPVVGYTDTFIGIGAFDTEIEANACLKYIKTKFARTMLGTLKATQHNPRETWANVPMQDFTSESDINWDAPISEIDKQLYSKYRLSDEEFNSLSRMSNQWLKYDYSIGFIILSIKPISLSSKPYFR